MSHTEKHRKELQELKSPLAEMPGDMPFHVPSGYFRQVIQDVMAKIESGSGTIGDDSPQQELEHLSPSLASASRAMPFFQPQAIHQPWRFHAPAVQEPPQTRNLSETPTPLRRLPTLRAAAAILALGTAAWLLRTQIASEVLPNTAFTQQYAVLELGKLDETNLNAFLRDTEAFTAAESIGIEDSWTDEAKDISSGEQEDINKELASIPEASLLAYTLETGLNAPKP